MNARARNFLAANELSPVVYGSVDGNCVTYRLQNGKRFNLTVIEAKQVPRPRWAFLEAEMHPCALKKHHQDERDTLAKVLAEAVER